MSQLRISDETEAFLAPALLPRTWLTQRLLLALREVWHRNILTHCLLHLLLCQGCQLTRQCCAPCPSETSAASARASRRPLIQHVPSCASPACAAQFNFKVQLQTPASSRPVRQAFGSDYLFTYLDEDTLCGLQTGSGGVFIFERAPDSEVPVLL